MNRMRRMWTIDKAKVKCWLIAGKVWSLTPLTLWSPSRALVVTLAIVVIGMAPPRHKAASAPQSQQNIATAAWVSAAVERITDIHGLGDIRVLDDRSTVASMRYGGVQPTMTINAPLFSKVEDSEKDALTAIIAHEIGHYWRFLDGYAPSDSFWTPTLSVLLVFAVFLTPRTPITALILLSACFVGIRTGLLGEGPGMFSMLGIAVALIAGALYIAHVVEIRYFGGQSATRDARNQLGVILFVSLLATSLNVLGRHLVASESRLLEADADVFAACATSPEHAIQMTHFISTLSGPFRQALDIVYDREHPTAGERLILLTNIQDPARYLAVCKALMQKLPPASILDMAQGSPK